MRLHTFVNNAEFGVQSLHVIADIGLESFKILAIFIQSMRYLLFKRVTRRRGVGCRLFIELLQACADLGHKLGGNVSNSFHRGWLEIFKSSVIEDFPDRSL